MPEGGICKSPYVNTGTPSQPSSSAALPGAVWLSCPHGDRDRAVAQGGPLPLGSMWHPDLPPPAAVRWVWQLSPLRQWLGTACG